MAEKYIADKGGVVEIAENTVVITDKRVMEILRIISSDERILKWVYDFAIGFAQDNLHTNLHV